MAMSEDYVALWKTMASHAELDTSYTAIEHRTWVSQT
jgi:hypothetical protein